MDYPREMERAVRFSNNKEDLNETTVDVKSFDSGSESDHNSFPLRAPLDNYGGPRSQRTSTNSPLPPPPPRSMRRAFTVPQSNSTTPTEPTNLGLFPPHLNSHPAFKHSFKNEKPENPFKHDDDSDNLFPLDDVEAYKIHDMTFRQTMGVDARRPFFDFDELQRQILGHYQYKLFKADRGTKYGMVEEKWEASRLLMKDYLDALQKYRWTQSLEKMSQSEYSHFTSTAEQSSLASSTCVGDFIDIASSPHPIDPLRRFLFRVLPESITIGQTSKFRRALHREWASAGLRKPPVVINSVVDGLARFLIAFFGGAFLLAPIILVNFVTGQNWRLIIASCFTVGFALVLAMVRAGNDRILAGAAAYAAVMVVYIGCIQFSDGQM